MKKRTFSKAAEARAALALLAERDDLRVVLLGTFTPLRAGEAAIRIAGDPEDRKVAGPAGLVRQLLEEADEALQQEAAAERLAA